MLFYPNRIENICAFRIHKTEADILDAQRSIKQKAQVNLSVVLRLNHGTAVYGIRNLLRYIIRPKTSISRFRASISSLRKQYNLRLMRCNNGLPLLMISSPIWADDIPLLSQRIKKSYQNDTTFLRKSDQKVRKVG